MEDPAAEIFPAQARRRSAPEIRLHHQVRRSRSKTRCGNVTELRCTADLESKSGGATSNRKIKGTIHWVSAAHAIDAEVRLYDRLFTVPEPDADGRLQIVPQPALARSRDREMRTVVRRGEAGTALSIRAACLFRARSGFPADKLVFNRTITLARYLGEGSEEIAASGASERTRSRLIQSRAHEHFFFPKNFEQMIKARPGIATCDGEARRDEQARRPLSRAAPQSL